MDPVRIKLQELIAARGESYSGLSLLLGRNSAYVHQFMTRGTPRKLSEDDCRILAGYFGVPEAELGGAEMPPTSQKAPSRLAAVPILKLTAAAGSDKAPDPASSSASMSFDLAWLARLGVKADRISIVHVQGDSMAPTLCDGDEIMVNHDDGGGRLRDGIYAVRLDDVLMVKRVVPGPRRGQITVGSDNPAYPTWSGLDADSLTIIGRVVWYGRRLPSRE